MTWRLTPPHPDEDTLTPDLQRRFDLHPLVARLLVRRGLVTDEGLRRFLEGTTADLPSPFGLPDMEAAVNRLLEAIARREKIVVFGDYDVDGITGTAQLCAYFREIGLPVHAVLPHRMKEGYGLTDAAVRKIAAEKPGLLITVDNGTKSAPEITSLKSLGMDVIVVDHHETPSPDAWPPVVALINPKRSDSKFPERDIASAGLVFFLLMALRARSRERGIGPLPNLKRYLDLACLGTIADVVPMTGTNRLLVKYGLKELGESTRPGLKALREVSGVGPPVNVTHVAFRLAPRINAAGRLADPKIALDLLLAERAEEAYVLASRLEELNRERQAIEEKVTREAIAQVEEDPIDRKGLVVAAAGWHLGVVGIVAAKVAERFGKPAVAFSFGDDGLIRGSARSIPGFSVYEPLKRIENLMLRFGGHAAAAGLTVAADRLGEFKNAFDRAVRDVWTEESSAFLSIDADLPLREVGGPLVRDLTRMEPFGPGNPEPLFRATGVTLEGSRLVGGAGTRGRGHLKTILHQDGVRFEGIGFNCGDYLPTALKTESHHVVFFPQINEWNGQALLQIKIKSICPST